VSTGKFWVHALNGPQLLFLSISSFRINLQFDVILFVSAYDLFNDVVSNSDYTFIGKDMEGSGRVQIQVTVPELAWSDEENHENPQSEQLVSEPRFEPGTTQTRSDNHSGALAKNAPVKAIHKSWFT
jgi:hypothetical protein